MPTLRSIGVHPDLCKRLVTESSSPHDSVEQFQSISTPQALLSRNPDQLRLLSVAQSSSPENPARRIPLQHAEELRSQVAVAMIRASKTGRRIEQVQGHVDSDSEDTHNSFLSVFELMGSSEEAPLPCSGCQSIDQALAGPASSMTSIASQIGIPWNSITQIAGPPGAGKSRLAQQIAANAHTNKQAVWYIYSGTMAASQLRSSPSVRLCGPTATAYQLLAHLAVFEEELLNATPEDYTKNTILIVDSCSGCCGPSLSSDTTTTSSIVSQVALTLKRLTRLYHLCTILINGTAADGTKPAMGNSWNTTVPDTSVWMVATAGSDRFDLQVSYSTTTVDPKTVVSPSSIPLRMDSDGTFTDVLQRREEEVGATDHSNVLAETEQSDRQGESRKASNVLV